MDAVLTALGATVPQLGVGGVLLFLLGLVIRWQGQERTDHRTDLAATDARHDTELRRLNADHDAELAELRAEIAGLRAQLAEVNGKLDAERDRRRTAEDSALGQLGRGDEPWRQS